MPRITSHLWFDKEAKQAAEFYAHVFKDSQVKNTATLHDTPSGSVDIVDLAIAGHDFTLISAGPLFKFTPAVSFLVACNSKEEVDGLWSKLSNGGSALMELGSYPFSERYGWIEDRYGVSWQLIYRADHSTQQRITPTLMFVGKQCGRAEEAIRFYASVFQNSQVGDIVRYGKNEEPDKEGTVKHAGFMLEGQSFAAMDSAHAHNFTFNEAISLMVHCDTQEQIDHYWEKLSADPKSEQCGWLKDKYGLSWQIVPTAMGRMMKDKDPARRARVIEAFLQMKKFDIAKLEEAYGNEGRSAA